MLYYESHITLDPVFESKLEEAKVLCDQHAFRVAKLLMQRRQDDAPELSERDTFASSRDRDLVSLEERMRACVSSLMRAGFGVRRYKIESVLIDSRVDDIYMLLE